ncbi:PxORF62 peptide [Plutella xylostella granulovirus]|nr:PxORF62 peptide [Plutella xylostella granulovirus]AAG27360.1 PxORF62 peptide [Plutella xylostella granulovirus]AMQ35672.1 PxGV-Corf60 protein [Plutella xylostella granulovirus]AMQ35789.1 PxGV-Korf60 protein [Plutella xylostella granulovirus]AMQ35906.1 PxGV-Morf60 protein [Plutella xylostella granulovirus]AMQ36023.1 PxGV-Torf60 protein [Plutella xylostella granulovirus]
MIINLNGDRYTANYMFDTSLMQVINKDLPPPRLKKRLYPSLKSVRHPDYTLIDNYIFSILYKFKHNPGVVISSNQHESRNCTRLQQMGGDPRVVAQQPRRAPFAMPRTIQYLEQVPKLYERVSSDKRADRAHYLRR